MKKIDLLIKPVSGRCNMHCRYCFYQEHNNKPNQTIMDSNLAEKIVEAAVEACEDSGQINFSFQGGEPTLAGLEFYEKFAECVETRKKTNIGITLTFQTNGTLLNEKWAEFFKKHNVLVGLSMDGTQLLHDRNRVDVSGNGTWSNIEKNWHMLQEYQVMTNILCVITGEHARHANEIYKNLKQIGAKYLQFIPCLDPDNEERGTKKYSLKPDAYEKFLCELFNLWYLDWRTGNYVGVRLFEDYINLLIGEGAASCVSNGRCGQYLVVEHDGSVYPCDFYVNDEWKVPKKIQEVPLKHIYESSVVTKFINMGKTLPDSCSNCSLMPICGGGCKRDWVINENGEKSNYYCSSIRGFFEYALYGLNEIVHEEINARRIASKI